jgi:hypothetical protein
MNKKILIFGGVALGGMLAAAAAKLPDPIKSFSADLKKKDAGSGQIRADRAGRIRRSQ